MRCLQLLQLYKKNIYKFIYLNTYSILLQLIAVVVFIFSLLLNSILIRIFFVSLSLILFFGSIFILAKYQEKKIKINKAIKFYYQNGLIVDYFKYFLVDPCSILVLKYILKIIHQENSFVKIKREGINYYKI